MLEWFNELSFFEQMGMVYVGAINLLTFFYYGIDKIKARHGDRRVSEMMLWMLALAGGSLGALLGMKFFRHKTKKLSFQAGISVILALQIGMTVFLMQK